MSADVIPFPPPQTGSLAVLARAAGGRWTDCTVPMVQVAIELRAESQDALRAKVRSIIDQGAAGLLAETDRALAEAAADLSLMLETIGIARDRLCAAFVACANPPELPAG